MAPFVFLVFVGIAIIVVVAVRRYMQGIATAWAEAGNALGLRYEQQRFGRPNLSGTMMGLRVQVDVRTQKSGNSQQTFTRYRVWLPPPGFQFRLTRQTGFSKITRFFGAQDVEVGDAGFDDAFVVKTDAEDRLRALMTPNLRGVLLRTAAAYPGVEFGSDVIHYERNRLESSRDAIVSAVRRLVDAAAAISGRRSLDQAQRIVAARERGDLAEIAGQMRKAAERSAESLDEEIVELDTLATAGDREAARERLRRLEREVPADPDVAGWKRRLEREQAEPEQTGRAMAEPSELAETLFAGNSLSFESKELFDANYRGASVRWTGAVKSVERIRDRSDLGEEGGDKLIATVATIDHDLYGNTDIDAVVGLPQGAASALRRGQEVTFTGKLVRIDSLVRNLFVAEGRLV